MQEDPTLKSSTDKQLLNELRNRLDLASNETQTADTPADERVLPEGKRVVRTKSSGDRVYYLDETKKTRQWVTNPDVLKGLGFELEDVVEIEDNELIKYQMASALYKVDGPAA